MSQAARAERLSIGTKTAFGIGQMAEGIKNNAFNIFVLFFYNQVLGLSGTLTGIALAIAIVCDAITDPLAGALSDRANTRWGRRHPFIAGSALPLAVTFFLLFSPPPGLGQIPLFMWLTVMAVLVRTAMTAYHIPHLALGAEMARNYEDRSSVFAYSTIFGFMGGIATQVIALRTFFKEHADYSSGLLNPAGYPRFAMFFALAMLVTILICAWGTRKEIPHLPKPLRNPLPFRSMTLIFEVRDVFRNASFRNIFFALFLGTLVLSTEGVFSTYMGVHFWGLRTDDQISLFPIAALFGLPLSFFLTPLFTRWFDKRNSIVICAVIAITAANVFVCSRLLGLPFIPENGTFELVYLLMTTSFIGAAIAPIIFATINSVFADICDEFELQSGRRVEGIVYAARAFALKATGGLGSMFGGILLDLIRFPTNAVAGEVPADVIWRLGLVQGPATSVFTMLSLIFYFRYKLDRKQHAEIAAALDARRREAQIEPEPEPARVAAASS